MLLAYEHTDKTADLGTRMALSGLQHAGCAVELDTACTFRGVATFGESVVVASNSLGQIWRSVNRGHNWTFQQISASTLHRIHACQKPSACDCYLGVCVGDNGEIHRTIDSGVTWNPVASGIAQDLLAVRLATDKIGYCVGRNGTILKTDDGGETWMVLPSPTSNDLQSVDCASPNVVAVVGDNATAVLSVDGGQTWREIPSVTDQPKAVVCFSDRNVVIFSNYEAPPPNFIFFNNSTTKWYKQLRFNGSTTTVEGDVAGRSVQDAVKVPSTARHQVKWCVDAMRWIPDVTNEIVAVGHVWQKSFNPNRTLDTGWDGGLLLAGDGISGPSYLSFGVVSERGLFAVCCPRKGIVYTANANDNIAPYDGYQHRDESVRLTTYDTPQVIDCSMSPGGSVVPPFGTLNSISFEELTTGGNDNGCLDVEVDWTSGSAVLSGLSPSGQFNPPSLCLVFPKKGGPVSTIPVPPAFLTMDEHFCGPIAACDIRVMSRSVPEHSPPAGANLKGDWNPRSNTPRLNLALPGSLGDCYRISQPYTCNSPYVVGDAWQENDFLYYGPPIGSGGNSRWRRIAAPQIWVTAIGIAYTPGGTFTDGTGATATIPAGWRPIPRYPTDGVGDFRVIHPPSKGLGASWHTFHTDDPAYIRLRDDRGLVVGDPYKLADTQHYHQNQPGDWSVGVSVCLWGSHPEANYRMRFRIDNVCLAWRSVVLSRGY